VVVVVARLGEPAPIERAGWNVWLPLFLFFRLWDVILYEISLRLEAMFPEKCPPVADRNMRRSFSARLKAVAFGLPANR